VGLVADLDDERLGRNPFGNGGLVQVGDRVDGRSPGLLFLFIGTFPGWVGSGRRVPVGFVSNPHKAVRIGG
jgi:hypothetical protein